MVEQTVEQPSNTHKRILLVEDNSTTAHTIEKMWKLVNPLGVDLETLKPQDRFDIRKYTIELDSKKAQAVGILFIDQFVESKSLRDMAQKMIDKFKELNPDVWIVETSLAPSTTDDLATQYQAIYEGSNSVIDLWDLQDLLRDFAKDPSGLGWQNLRFRTNSAYMAANELDNPGEPVSESRMYELFIRLSSDQQYIRLLKVLGLQIPDELYGDPLEFILFKVLTDDSEDNVELRQKILHAAFQTVGAWKAGAKPGMPLQRLMEHLDDNINEEGKPVLGLKATAGYFNGHKEVGL